MNLIAKFPTPEGDIVVSRGLYQRHSGMQPWTDWTVDVPGLGQFHYSRKRDAMHHAKAAIRLLTPPPRMDLVKGWNMLRTYG